MSWLDVFTPSAKIRPACPASKKVAGRPQTVAAVGLSSTSSTSSTKKCKRGGVPGKPATFDFRTENTESLSRQGEEAQRPAKDDHGPKRRNTPFVRNGVWLRDAPPSTPLDTLRCWGLPPRLERGELVLEGWEALDEPTRAGIGRWLEHARHRERVTDLLNKIQGGRGA